jgi:hypothetical protein
MKSRKLLGCNGTLLHGNASGIDSRGDARQQSNGDDCFMGSMTLGEWELANRESRAALEGGGGDQFARLRAVGFDFDGPVSARLREYDVDGTRTWTASAAELVATAPLGPTGTDRLARLRRSQYSDELKQLQAKYRSVCGHPPRGRSAAQAEWLRKKIREAQSNTNQFITYNHFDPTIYLVLTHILLVTVIIRHRPPMIIAWPFLECPRQTAGPLVALWSMSPGLRRPPRPEGGRLEGPYRV